MLGKSGAAVDYSYLGMEVVEKVCEDKWRYTRDEEELELRR